MEDAISLRRSFTGLNKAKVGQLVEKGVGEKKLVFLEEMQAR